MWQMHLLRMDDEAVRSPIPRRFKVRSADGDLLPLFPIWYAGRFLGAHFGVLISRLSASFIYASLLFRYINVCRRT